jgi:aminopeptidase N
MSGLPDPERVTRPSIIAQVRKTGLAVLVAALVTTVAGCTHDPTHEARYLPSPTPSVAPSVRPVPGRAPVADPIYPDYGNPGIDVTHYGLDLSWDPGARKLTGTATLALRAVGALASVSLDFSDAYQVTRSTLDGAAVPADVKGHKLVVAHALAQGATATLVVAYTGKPTTVPMPSHRTDIEPLGLTVTKDGSLWTMQEPYGSSTWYPSNDQPSDKALYDIAVTVPAGWSAIASGSPGPVDGGTFHYGSTVPVASYLTTLAVGHYDKETATGPHGLPLTYWFPTGTPDGLKKVVRQGPAQLTWLEGHLGAFPFPSTGVLVVPSDSAMETQQMVTLGALADSPGFGDQLDADLTHEYAHQWFGDDVTPTTWQDLWLNEGFAEYLQFRYQNERDHVDMDSWAAQMRAADAKLRKQAGPPGHPDPDAFAEGNVYLCPALMLWQITKKIGDDKFFAMARAWATDNAGGNQDRAGFIAFVDKFTGQDFTSLINSWLDSPTTPAS